MLSPNSPQGQCLIQISLALPGPLRHSPSWPLLRLASSPFLLRLASSPFLPDILQGPGQMSASLEMLPDSPGTGRHFPL